MPGVNTAHMGRMCLELRRAMNAPWPKFHLSITAIPSAAVKRRQTELLAEGVSAILKSTMFHERP